MSNINISDINREETESMKEKENEEEIYNKKDKKIKKNIDKDKDKEKETYNLLEDTQNFETGGIQYNYFYFCNSKKSNEIFYFLLLSAFIYTVYILTKIKENSGTFIDPYFQIIDYNEETNATYNNLLPTLSLAKKNESSLKEIFNSRVLYIEKKNITKRYISYIRPIDDEEEKKFTQQLYKDLKPNDTFGEDRPNFYKREEFIKLCKQEKLISTEKVNASSQPLISIIITSYNQKNEIMKSIRSIQNQSFKNIEIILVDDLSTEKATDLFNSLLETEPRVRIFYHLKNMGKFRSRLDGFLYSRGKYILHFEAGDLFADNYVLEDLYYLITKYNLDSITFSFKIYKKKKNHSYDIKTMNYPNRSIKIKYGKVRRNVTIFGYGTMFNRLTRANIFTKGIKLFDWYILNAYKNLWEDTWWNKMVNAVSSSHLFFNRIGYIYYTDINRNKLKLKTKEERDRTMREFIYFWLFDYQLVSPDNSKKFIINKLRNFNMKNNTFFRQHLNLNYLTTNFTVYEHLLKILMNDPCVSDLNRPFLNDLITNYTDKFYNNKNDKIFNNSSYDNMTHTGNIPLNVTVNN